MHLFSHLFERVRRGALTNLRIVVIKPFEVMIAIERLNMLAHPAAKVAVSVGVDFDFSVPSQEWFNLLCQPHDTAAILPAQRAVLSSLILAILVKDREQKLDSTCLTLSLDNLGKRLYFLYPGRINGLKQTMAKVRTDLMQGTLELLILKTLSRDQMHGYGIAQRIHEAVDDLLKVEDGSLYPALYRMEERGWIASEWGVSDNNRRAKFYRLTKAGRKRLEGERANWERVSQAIGRILETA